MEKLEVQIFETFSIFVSKSYLTFVLVEKLWIILKFYLELKVSPNLILHLSTQWCAIDTRGQDPPLTLFMDPWPVVHALLYGG